MDWFDVLEVCRSLGRAGTKFKPVDLQTVANFPDTFTRGGTKKSSGLQKASSWCAKLVKMKMLEQAGVDEEKAGPGRKGYFYRVSDAGRDLKTKPLSKLDRLLRAVNALRAARGKPEEGRLYAHLFEVAAEVERELPLSSRGGGDD